MKFGELEMNPAVNPGVLDTGTWDVPAAAAYLRAQTYDGVDTAAALRRGAAVPLSGGVRAWNGSASVTPGAVWFLASLPDGQAVLACVGKPGADQDLGRPFDERTSPSGEVTRFFPTSAPVLDAYCRLLKPAKAPRALGATPRLGIGTRMTTQVWPGIFDAMVSRGMAANSIQNSIRELCLLDDLLAGKPPEKNYSTGIGTIEMGWTGSTYEGLLVAGVLAALMFEGDLTYGADADHVQVKRGPDGVERARRVIRAARYYSFYTLDMADVLNYAALGAPAAESEAFLTGRIPDEKERAEVVEWHARTQDIGGKTYAPDRALIGRFVGKYWDALAIVRELAAYIASLKAGVAFDLELTIDEHPPEVAAFDCLTTDEEVLFLAREIKRRRLPITHLAPNFGQEKGHDYRGPDGRAGLEARARAQFGIASAFGLMLDVHSGDDLGRETRRVFGRASGGRVHFKVSPMLQIIYAEVLQEYHPDLFRRWWDDALAYARREAANGSPTARECLAELETDPAPSPRHRVFHSYSFPFVGRRDASGQFLNRAEFYTLSPAFLDAHRRRIGAWLGEIADDVFNSTTN